MKKPLKLKPRCGCLLFLMLFLAWPFAWYYGSDWYWKRNPNAAFESITGSELPPGVVATHYGSMEDAFIHRSHMWRLAGDPAALRKVVAGTDFIRMDTERSGGDPSYYYGRFGLGANRKAVVTEVYTRPGIREDLYIIVDAESEAFYHLD